MIWTRGRAFWPSSLTEFHPDSKSWDAESRYHQEGWSNSWLCCNYCLTIIRIFLAEINNSNELESKLFRTSFFWQLSFPFFNQAVGHYKHWRFLYYVNFGILEYRAPYDVSRVHRWQRNSIITGTKGHTVHFLVFRKWSKKCSGSLTKCLINENKPDDDQHYIKTKSSTKWTLWKRWGFKLHSLW